VTFLAYALREPTSDRAAAAADLKAPSPAIDVQALDTSDRQWIETLLEQREPTRLEVSRLRKCIVRRFVHPRIFVDLPTVDQVVLRRVKAQ
jgi:hypothetical protein